MFPERERKKKKGVGVRKEEMINDIIQEQNELPDGSTYERPVPFKNQKILLLPERERNGNQNDF